MATVMATDMDKMRTNIRHIGLALISSLLSATAYSQTAVPGAISNTSNAPGNLTGQNTAIAPPIDNQGASSQGRAWSIKPRVNLTETWTDNVRLGGTQNSGEADLITQIAPGIRIDGKSARLKAFLDYSLNAQTYLKSDNSRIQNALNSFATLEAVDNWLYVDASARISQQAISAFGAQSPSTGSINSNSTETSTLRLSPYIRGQFGGWADYALRYNRSTTRSDASTVSNVDLDEWAGQLSGATPFRAMRWSLDATRQAVDYSSGRETEASRFFGRLTYLLTPQFRVIGSAGWEENNYASIDQQARTTHGYGFDWNPTERTQVSAFKERRFFGDGHNINISHRFPRSSIRFTDSRDVSVLPNQFSSVGQGNVYDIYFEQFASLIPDPVQRAAFVNAFLAQNGINPNTQVTSSFLSSRATIQRRQQLSLTLQGARNSVTFLANRNQSESTLASTALIDDFSQANVIRQQGFSLNFSHKLSEITNLNALLSRQESSGSGTTSPKTTTNLMQLNLSTKLGPKTTGSLSVRHSESDGTSSFKEKALIGVVSYIY